MMSLEQLVTNYGYLAIFIGTLLEGETILIIGGFLVHRGYLKLYIVIILSFFGTLISDQLLFLIGRWKGKRLLEKYNFIKSRINRVNKFLDNNENYVLFGFRFIYGLRTLTPLVLGTTKVKTKKYVVFNIISASVWSVTFGVAGYLIGSVLEKLIGRIENLELEIIILIIIVSLLFWIYKWRKSKK